MLEEKALCIFEISGLSAARELDSLFHKRGEGCFERTDLRMVAEPELKAGK